MMCMKSHRRAMTLVDLLMSVVVVTLLVLTLIPALSTMRDEAENEQSKANLMQIGQGRDQYAGDNQDRIFAYSWRAGETYTLPNGQVRTPITDQDAAAEQNKEILMRRTGRINGVYKFLNFNARLPHRRYSHLILLDYLAGADDEQFQTTTLAIDPADQTLLTWHERPLQYGTGSGIPYSNGTPFGYDSDFNWTTTAVRQRWAFGSSYEIVPFAWQGDGPNDIYLPVSSTPHLFQSSGAPELGRRMMSEVASPSRKVHLFEEFDREQKRYPWFAYNTARVEKLMFDGSINSQPSNASASAEHPQIPGVPWRQRYIPLDQFPIPLDGFGETREINLRFRWTAGGLQGIDY